MYNMKHYLFLVTLLSLFVACEKSIDPFMISSNSVGFLTDSTMIKELKTVFINDSLSKYIGGDEFTGTTIPLVFTKKRQGSVARTGP